MQQLTLVATTLSVATVVTSGVYVLVLQRHRRDPYAALPQPPSTLPVLGNLLDVMVKHRTRIHDWLADICTMYDGQHWLLTSLGREPSIVLGTVDAYEDILKLQFDAFAKYHSGDSPAKDYFGNGIVAAEGADWVHQRKTAGHLFSVNAMRDIMESVIANYAAPLCDKFERAASTRTAVDFKHLIGLFATDVFTRIGFGVDLGCLRGDQPDDVFAAFSRGSEVVHARTHQPMFWWRLKRWLNVGMEKQMKADMKLVNDKVYEVIRASIEQVQTGEKAAKDLISLFLDKKATTVTHADGTTITVETTPEMIRDMSFNFITAGRGTTAHSITWFMVMMNRYPDVLLKVQEELQREIPKVCDGTQVVPTLEEANRLVYLEATIRENLRLNPGAPFNSRVCVKDTVLRDGTLIRKGTIVVIPIYATGRLKSIWGHDATEFKPERWFDADTGKLLTVPPYKYLAFGAGPRNCVGAKLAMMEMKITIAALLSKFEFHCVSDPFQFTYETSLSLPVLGPVTTHVSKVNPVLSAVAG